MHFQNLLFAFVGFLLGILFIGIIGKIYVENLHHVACKMYNSVENSNNYGYVNTQFRCDKNS